MVLSSKTESAELEQLRTRVRLLKEMAGHINSGLDGSHVIRRTLLDAQQCLPHLRISFGTLNADGLLRIVHSVSPLHMPGIEGHQFEMKETEVLTRLLRPGKPIAITDIDGDDRAPEVSAFMRRFSARSLLAVRVQHPEHQLAALSFATSSPREWSDHERAMITDITEYLAIAMRENQMLSEQQQAGERLQEAQRMEAVGRLVGGVAHDFNNILTGMMIYTGLLASALGPENPLLRHVRELQAAGERGASLVGQLLSLTRKHVLETRLMSLNDVVSNIRDMLQRLVGEDILVECHLAGDLPMTPLDENQLRQSILNLAVNARDAMKQGGRLILSTEAVTADPALVRRVPALRPGQYAVLRLSDTGVGMDAETLDHCFEPFYTTKPPGEGTGLGLAAVFGALQQHGGAVHVQSQPGAGTTFELFLPVRENEHPSAPVGTPRARPRHTVLLVEDESMLRIPLRERLEQEGHHVLSAATPDAGLEVASRFAGPIHLLITDLVMPRICGQEMAVRMEADRPDMKVLFMSGYTDDPRARRLIAHGANFLRKPFDSEHFVAKVRELLQSGGPPPVETAGMQKNTSILGKET